MSEQKIAAIWVSWERDSEILFESVSHLKSLDSDVMCYVIDDINKPVKKHIRERLEKAGVKWVESDKKRPHNLRGMEWIIEQSNTFAEIADDSQADILLKVDSDTIVNDLSPLDYFKNKSIIAFGAKSREHALYGAAVAIRAEGYRAILKELNKLPHWCVDELMYPPQSIEEDVFISRLIYHIYGAGAVHGMPLSKKSGWLSSYSYSNSKVGLEYYAKSFSCVTFGDRTLVNNDYKAILKAMQEFCNLCQNIDSRNE